jgi:3-oxoadipate enol-lactonase/4-carboxymuconolactone decarboxylase
VTGFAERDGRKIAWSSLGGGQALLLVPGLGAGSRLFGTLPRRFARAGFRCLTYDPAGIAPSSPPAGPWSFTAAADDLIAVLDAAGADRAVLVGTSLGGKVALAAAHARPERVPGLALLASSAIVTPRARRIYRFFELIARRLDAEEIGEATAPFLFGSAFHEQRPELVADIVRSMRPDAATRALMIEQAQALAGYDAAMAGGIRCPTLVVGGSLDTLTTLDELRATAAAIPGARLRVIENAGHSLLLESAETFDAVVELARGSAG